MSVRRRDRSARLVGYARNMRKEPTEAERMLWSILRGNNVGGFHFRRQVPIEGYIVDFFCAKAKLAVEADGGQHTDEEQQRYDDDRSAVLEASGIRMLRFSDVDVLQSIDAVGEAILHALTSANSEGVSKITPPPLPSPGVPGEGVRGNAADGEIEDLVWFLLSSDLAQEIKSEFNGRLAVGLDVAAATQHVLSHFQDVLHDPQHGPVVLVSLAALQLREHQLHTVIRDAVLDLISTGEAAAAYPATSLDARTAQQQLLGRFAAALAAAPVVDD
jgi:very-short-patch-repair endonuclease